LLISRRGSYEDRASVVRDAFRQYTDAKREFLAITERCYLKGWPDRKAALQHFSKVCALIMEQESLRFDYLMSGIFVEAAVWKSLTGILNRISKDWKDSDEVALETNSPAYRDITNQLTAAGPIDKAALDGPYKGAEGDPEFRSAIHAFNNRRIELDERLASL
jgi:hypothetical protein